MNLNPWNEAAWTALSQLTTGREFGRPEQKAMTGLLNQLFVNFAAFPDFTLTVFEDLISFEKEMYERAVPIFERAGQIQLAQTYQAGARQMKAGVQ
ncbi:MAG: hypothetical protein R3C59_19945 [Planctomycetaceae bacterium]